MAAIKSFTSLEQSKKLAKILPLESADMYYFDDNGEEPKFKVRNGITYYYASEDCLCCWSLAALLSVLPKIGAEEPMIIKLYYANEPKERYICEYGLTNITSEYDNPVDACYEMIIRLHDLKML